MIHQQSDFYFNHVRRERQTNRCVVLKARIWRRAMVDRRAKENVEVANAQAGGKLT
jgi:hypothetical protein